MLKQITKISIHQSSKIIAIINFLLAFIFVVPLSLFLAYENKSASFFGFLILPFVNLIVSYITCAILFWLYNIVASSFGGIQFHIDEK